MDGGSDSAATTRSNGTSRWASAGRAASRIRSSSSTNVGSPEVSVRSATRSVKGPITPFRLSSSSWRGSTVPSTMSVPEPSRVSSIASAACTAMNVVAPCSSAASANLSCASASRLSGTESARCDARCGRGRSMGSGIVAATSASASFQKAS